MNKFYAAAALGVGCLSMGACATVTRGTNTAWEVNTTPPGASVKTTNGMECDSTPCSLRMSRKAEFTATISKPGYRPVVVQVTTKIGAGGGLGMAGNVVLGGLIGAGVDVATGAMNDLTPNPVNLSLEKSDGHGDETPVAYQPPAPPPVSPEVGKTPADQAIDLANKGYCVQARDAAAKTTDMKVSHKVDDICAAKKAVGA